MIGNVRLSIDCSASLGSGIRLLQGTASGGRQFYQHKIIGGIKVIFPAFVDNAEIAVLSRVRVRKHPVHLCSSSDAGYWELSMQIANRDRADVFFFMALIQIAFPFVF